VNVPAHGGVEVNFSNCATTLLAEALAALAGRGWPVLLVCRPGVLTYFEPEYESGAGQRYILQRPDAEPDDMLSSGDS